MILTDFDFFKTQPNVKFHEEEICGKKFITISYMIADNDFWKIPSAKECRGNTFDPITGKWLIGTFPKFFNVGENEDVVTEKIKNNFIECYEQRDGSLVTPYFIGNKKRGFVMWFKTKKNFDNDVARAANKASLLNKDIEIFSKWCFDRYLTPIFELTSPSNKAVIDYGVTPELTLLAVRCTDSGLFMSYDEIKGIITDMKVDVKLIQRLNKTWDEIINDIETLTNFEGYVLLLRNGTRVKIKTKWYLQLRHTMTVISYRHIAEAVLNESVDDLKSLISRTKYSLDKIENVEQKIIFQLNKLKNEVESLVKNAKDRGLSTKDFAMKSKQNPLMGLMMDEWKGKMPDYADYYKRHLLKNDFSTECAYNHNFSKLNKDDV